MSAVSISSAQLPLVSVIVPVYNVQAYLNDCLESILEQTYQNLEIICVEDQSTDDSLSILKEYAARFSQIHLLENEINLGLSGSRNRGMKQARGQYIYFVDSDDMLTPNCIERFIGEAESTDADIVFCHYEEINSSGGTFYDTAPEKAHARDFDSIRRKNGQEVFTWMIKTYDGLLVTAWQQFYKASFLKKSQVNFHPRLLHEDILFSTQILLLANKVSVIPDKLYLYRRHYGETISTVTNPLRAQSLFFTVGELWKIWQKSADSWSEEFNRIYKKHLSNVLSLYLSYRVQDGGNHAFAYGNCAVNFLYQMMRNIDIKVEPRVKIDALSENLIEHSKNIYIYGAGAYAYEALSYLKKYGYSPKAFMVSNLSGNPSRLDGIPVVVFSERILNGDDCLIVGIKPNRAEELTQHLKQIAPCPIIKLIQV